MILFSHPRALYAAIIDGRDSGPVAIFNQAEGAGATLKGFTIQRGSATNSGAIYCSGSSPTILYNQIKQSSASSNGGGIYCKNGSPTISHNKISACSAGDLGVACTVRAGRRRSPAMSSRAAAPAMAAEASPLGHAPVGA